MNRQQRVALLRDIENARNSRVVAVIMGDRPALETRIAPDLVPLVARHLRTNGKVDRIDLLLYSTGGDVMTGYRLVGLIREYCRHFSVLVPFRCQSTATLVTLGADEIVMLQEGQLSPVDPSIQGPYNPPIPGVTFQPGMPLPVLPVSVEEVVSYFRMAKEVGELKSEAALTAVFERLTSDVRPLALGQVYRARTQIRMLSRKLLQSHMGAEDTTIDAIVETLTEKLYSHDYLISRHEAKALGLKVKNPEPALEESMVRVYEMYATDLELGRPYNPIAVLQGQTQRTFIVDRAYVESTEQLDAFQTERTLARTPDGRIADQIIREGWSQIK